MEVLVDADVAPSAVALAVAFLKSRVAVAEASCTDGVEEETEVPFFLSSCVSMAAVRFWNSSWHLHSSRRRKSITLPVHGNRGENKQELHVEKQAPPSPPFKKIPPQTKRRQQKKYKRREKKKKRRRREKRRRKKTEKRGLCGERVVQEY